ncbi:hypothetical protein A3A40_00810 [Candidatus Kaiserbacteria bacterium RIFCSPLOWO2_01_FULL_54_20]|uniref:Uncharacterized protein n=1 Tax=Candidatus Kaiserbacteria bacterium RIFCSPLOWO2_01_FULL_54_20 TaxID=1798513 RepID=A0A1F6EJG3_9BACT|nr:MAG: hypothetical protein A3A40_00810 [Candidatus Kaiserbacteria bacterium RIFCSPLOWO2_01_FULL_54_20]
MKKSQIFSLDFVFSMVVLVLILSILGSTWLNLQNSLAQQENRRRAVENSAAATDFLVSSQGFPEDWQNSANLSLSSVSNIGLKGTKGVSLAKLLALANVSTDYYALKDKMGLAKYHFRLVVSENFSNSSVMLSGIARQPVAYFASDSRVFFNALTVSGEVWDYYWGQGVLGAPNWGSSRNQYSGVKDAAFNQMLASQDSYNTIVVESPEFPYADANATLLKQFLEKGGTVVYLAGNGESELLVQNLGLNFRKSGLSVDGVVQKKGFFLQNSSVGANVSSGGRWVAFSPNGLAPEIFVSNSTNSSEALAVSWNYGLGKVYFISDFQADFNGIPGENVFNVVGWKLEYGVAPYANASFVFPQTRFSFVEGDRRIPAAITLVLWND